MTMILMFGVSALGELRWNVHSCLYAHTYTHIHTHHYTQAHLCVYFSSKEVKLFMYVLVFVSGIYLVYKCSTAAVTNHCNLVV